MKTENDFNAYLSKQFKRMRNLRALKTADKYSPGISDFLLWKDGKGAFLETKYIKDYPKPNRKLLTHTFSTKQLSFLEEGELRGGCPAWGAIGVGSEKKIYCFPWYLIPSDGNWKTEEFLKQKSRLSLYYDGMCAFQYNHFTDIEKMVEELFVCQREPTIKEVLIHVD